jgi:RNA polymerase sigma-70 factor (ECF subfamily)
MKHDEQELIARILDGDEDAYGTLIDRYKTGLYHHCFKLVHDEDVAEDITHEAFIEAFVHLETFDPRFRFSTWLYKIATNLALTYLRKRRDIRLGENEVDRILSTLPDTEQFALYRELHAAVDDLPPNYRTVVSMHYWHGKSYSEIASTMGTSVGSIKGWMSRAKRQLKETLS